ncbi:hypothetical protein OAI01_01325 [Alphaproteobacteria bacterium]|nr:hypothetical protein [Alphaproteobacteria bacterium]
MGNSKNEIIINCAYSFMPGTDYVCKIVSAHKNNTSTIEHLSFYDGDFISEDKIIIKGSSNFLNLIKGIVNFQRDENGCFFLPYEGMKQGVIVDGIDEGWKENFIIFCLGGKDETRECYGKPFLNIDEQNLSKLFSLKDIFSFIDLYEEFLWHVNLKPSEINLTEIFNKYKVKDFLNFDKLLVSIEKEEEKEIQERKKIFSKFQKYFDTHQHKIEIQYLKGGGSMGRTMGSIIARRSVVFFIEFYFRKNMKFPKGEHYISYFKWEDREKINQYEDFKNTEDKRVNFK